jgi:DNA-binding PadR family transcriptional regulator
MSLPDVLLSLLREPMSGSELIRLFRGTIDHFWNTDLSQVYRALESLDREGCLRSRSEPSERGPARKVYRLTARGRQRLGEWVRRTPRVPPAKFEYLAQLFSVTADPSPRQQALRQLRSMREEAAGKVALLDGIDHAMAEAPGYPDAMPAHLFYPWLTLRHGLIRRRALLAWIDESIERVERRPASDDEPIPLESFQELMRVLKLFGAGPTNDKGEGR